MQTASPVGAGRGIGQQSPWPKRWGMATEGGTRARMNAPVNEVGALCGEKLRELADGKGLER